MAALLVISQLSFLVQTIWVAYWVDQPTADKLAKMGYYLAVYAVVSFAEPCTRFFFRYVLDAAGWRAAYRIHLALLRAVTGASLSWHSSVPVGRIVNRFSRDMSSIDWDLRPILETLSFEMLSCLFRLTAGVAVFPIFAIPCTILVLISIFISETYTRTVVHLRLIESSSLSPVFSIFQDHLAGLEVIRGHAHGPRVTLRELSEALNVWASARASTILAARWFSIRIGFLVSFVTVAAGGIAIAKSSTLATGLIGLALVNVISMNQIVIDVLKQLAALESEMQRFGRVEEYATIPPEEDKTADSDDADADSGNANDDDNQSINTWPENGTVELKNVCVRYSPEGTDILHDINLTFRAGERVAIVGRTGSGKSTLALTLLRFTYLSSGQILFSGRDISTIPRRDLRKSIALIPQEPVLLSGTVVWNLDPTGTVPREALDAAVRSCSDVSSITATSADSSWADRDARVEPGGENLSHGQRQVLALCRALARRSQLVVLDEATANMDYETDKGIQRVLRREVAAGGGRTLVTIAHRLRTVADYDKVVVLAGGRVLEYVFFC